MNPYGWTAVFLLFILMQINKQRELAACGQLQNVLDSRITSGHDTHRWPWHAAIYHQFNESDSTYQCGGTLVSPKFVITAAHCVSVAAERLSVSLGRLHLNASQSSAPFIKVAEILTHPQYSEENYANDIAIITLSTDAIINNYVQPICMWKSVKMDLSEVIGKFGTVVGWGLTENGVISNALQEASLPVVPSLTCLGSDRDLFGRFLTTGNFCAGTRNGTSVCTGDSGGSMTFPENGRYYIRGIVSVSANKLVDRSTNKFMCDSMQYAIFTDVAQYLPWIRETIECETFVECDFFGTTDTCGVILTVDEFECNIIFDETSNVSVKVLQVAGDESTDVPDLSSAVVKFKKLEGLGLHSFKQVERSRLSPFRNILELVIESFLFTQLDADTFIDLNDLENLSIVGSNLTTLPAGIFRNNKKIRDLYLFGNHLIELHPDVFEVLRNVEQLTLENNELTNLPANIFRNNEKMIRLRLSLNYFKEFHEDLFSALTNLEGLDVSRNLIEYLPSGLFRSNSKLTTVLLSFNKIKKIEVDLTNMPRLLRLKLEGNSCIDEDFNFPDQSLSQANEIIRRKCRD